MGMKNRRAEVVAGHVRRRERGRMHLECSGPATGRGKNPCDWCSRQESARSSIRQAATSHQTIRCEVRRDPEVCRRVQQFDAS